MCLIHRKKDSQKNLTRNGPHAVFSNDFKEATIKRSFFFKEKVSLLLLVGAALNHLIPMEGDYLLSIRRRGSFKIWNKCRSLAYNLGSHDVC